MNYHTDYYHLNRDKILARKRERYQELLKIDPDHFRKRTNMTNSICKVCGKKFTSSSNCGSHMKRVHS